MMPPLLLVCLTMLACKPAVDEDDPKGDTGVHPDPPVARIEAPSSARVGELVTLDGSGSSDPQGLSLLGWSWTCTDGSEGEGETAEFRFQEGGTVSCTLKVTSESGLEGSASKDIDVSAAEGAAWTVMVFLAADNDLEEAAVIDFNEMEMVGSTDDVNIVAQLDRAQGGYSGDGNWSGSRRFLVEQDSDPFQSSSPVLEDLGETDSGDPQTVIDFVEWGIETFPAERYALVFWNHGWGWSFTGGGSTATKGVASDDSTGNDISIAEGELEDILIATQEAAGGRIELLGMDACLMGSWEVAHVAAPYAEVYVSSQATEGLEGWPYHTFLADLVADPTMDGATLGEHIAFRFNETRDATQSVLDLRMMDDLAAAIDGFAQAVLDADEASNILQIARNAQDFEWGYGVDKDMGHLLQLVAQDTSLPQPVLDAAADMEAARAASVLSNYTHGNRVRNATGVSIYAPSRRVDSLYLQGRWSEDTLWDDMLQSAGGDR